ncbi:hypothetical protein KUCAC02_008738 [Chaenocephalus aceratus]|uniref:Uncharacterized protein n=1 Tax=Chaenocephalus aceratus TaxID=36190 RepID=A0ACB9WSZ1_CHAAC|nr:hypothetical protein KUCAC02_008738 [Chaenocephalus aceratus]
MYECGLNKSEYIGLLHIIPYQSVKKQTLLHLQFKPTLN